MASASSDSEITDVELLRQLKVTGRRIAGKYVVQRIVGRGGMGCVAIAKHADLDQLVAIKFVLPEVAKNPDAVRRFLREAKMAAKLTSEHVVRVFDVGRTEDDVPYLVMEYLEGRDLGDVLEKSGPLAPVDAVDYTLQAISALAEAHARGIVHRDLKPANLYLADRAGGDRILKILDFGISKLEDDGAAPSNALTHTRTLMGSPLYMSPEQVRSARAVDPRSDLWALGVVLHELLTGQLPFNGESVGELFGQILHVDAPSICAANAALPAELAAVILKCLRRDREQRYANAAELAEALAPFASPAGLRDVARARQVVATLASTPRPIYDSSPEPEVTSEPRLVVSVNEPHLAVGESEAHLASAKTQLHGTPPPMSKAVPVDAPKPANGRRPGILLVGLVVVVAGSLAAWAVVSSRSAQVAPAEATHPIASVDPAPSALSSTSTPRLPEPVATAPTQAAPSAAASSMPAEKAAAQRPQARVDGRGAPTTSASAPRAPKATTSSTARPRAPEEPDRGF